MNRALFRIAQKQKENRQVEKTRLIKKHAKRFAEQNRIEKTRTEEIRLIKKRVEFFQQQKIEQTRIAKKQFEIFACKRCNAKFFNNIKFHIHVQNHHQKKIEKFANEFAKTTSIAIFASIIFSFTSKTKFVTITISESTSKAMITMFTFFATFSSSSESTLMFTSFSSQSKSISKFSLSDTSFVISKQSFIASTATSKTQIFWIEIVSRSIIASKFSRLSIFTSKSISNALKIATIVCSFISSFIFSQKSVSKHQHQKFYFIIDDLFEMFAEKRSQSDLLHIKKRASFSNVFFFIKSTLRSISDLRSIRANRLVKIRKFQIRKVFSNICLRNRIASNSSSTNDLRNRSFYHTKHRFFFACLSQRNRTFCHTKCQIFHIFDQWSHFANLRLIYSIHLFSFMSVAFATIFSNWTMFCIDIYERFISVKRFVVIWRILRNAIISIAISKILDFLMKKWVHFLISLHVLLIDFSKNECCSRHATQRERCNLFRSMTFVTIQSSHRVEVKISWQERTSVLAIWFIFRILSSK